MPAAKTSSATAAPIITISELEEVEDGFIDVLPLSVPQVPPSPRSDKASRILGISHRRSMEPLSRRSSVLSTRSLREPSVPPNLPVCSLYLVSGLPKSPNTWSFSDPESVLGLKHSENAVNRFWRPEVLGSTISPGVSSASSSSTASVSGKRKKSRRDDPGISKQESGRMLSKALKLSFTREVEIICSTLQPASTVHTFTFSIGASASDRRLSAFPYPEDRPSFLTPEPPLSSIENEHSTNYYGVCLTVWSHADAERSAAIRRTLEAGRSRKESLGTSRIKGSDPTWLAKRAAKKAARSPWTDIDTDGGADTDAVSESDFEAASVYTVTNHAAESSLFLPGDQVFWLPYALTLVSRHPIYDVMKDYLCLSWARFSRDVSSHTALMTRILSLPSPRAGELIRINASPPSESPESSLELISRFPGGLDFGHETVDVNFTMWPLFQCLSIENILTICEIALCPTGRVLFVSRHPSMLGMAVSTIKYIVELRGWNGIALQAVHIRDAKIYIEDMGPWLLGLSAEARYGVRPPSDVCVVDLDINYISCASPPLGAISSKQHREKYRQRLLSAFDPMYHPDHSVPSEFKEAFPAGRFRPLCKIQAYRGGSAVAEQISPPSWWNSTKVIQAFDSVLQDRYKKPSILKRIPFFGAVKQPPKLTAAEARIQLAIRKRATAFVDARDDLETKIGRLSRRLNFLMTESDLWRDKFVTFEQYAEKLSAEAGTLRNKISQEKKESKRLSGIVLMTAAEKTKLQNQLRETEVAHKEAMGELDNMRETMERMEQERAEMVAEIEAQIERALASMTVGMDDSDYGSSRPSSRLSHQSRSRRPSDAGKARHMRSFGTESTLAESCEEGAEPAVNNRLDGPIQEEDEEEGQKKSFSSTDYLEDSMQVDEGINEKSERIAQKVMEIQQKLESALATDRRVAQWKNQTYAASTESEEERSDSTHTRPPPRPARRRRDRSGTASSTQTTTPRDQDGTETPVRRPLIATPAQPKTSSTDASSKSKVESKTLTIPNSPRHPTDDSDTDFQSAYSQASNSEDEDSLRDLPTSQNSPDEPDGHRQGHRKRISSTSTIVTDVRD